MHCALQCALCTVDCTVVSSEEQAVGGPGVAAQSCAGSPPCHTSMASSCLILQVDCSPPSLTQCFITSVFLLN